jgi:trimeric autotransporter adhesin
MKTFQFHPVAKAFSVLLPALLAFSSAHAVTFCVSDVATLENALLFSTINIAEPSTIRIVQGTYLATTDWTYSAAAPLSLEGGYSAGCATRLVNPANTIISAPGHRLGIQQLGAIPQASLAVDGITFSNAANVALTAGAFGSAGSDGSLYVSRSRFTQLSNAGAPLSFLAQGGVLKLDNLQIDNISVGNTAPNNCAVNIGGIQDATILINHVTADIRNDRSLCIGTGSSGLGVNGGTAQVFLYNSIIWASDDSNSNLKFIVAAPNPSITIVNSIHRAISGGTNFSVVNPITAAPAWVDATNGNYRLASSSPAINSGEIVVLGGEPATDIESNARITGSRPDRGAYESLVVDSSVLTVTNQLDAGAGSLRQAILNANASPTLAKTIKFDIRSANNTPICPAVIALGSNLPALAAPIVIDGYSQPGATVNTSALAFNANLCVLLKPATGSLGVGLMVPASAAASTALNLRGIGLGGFSQPVLLLGGSGHVLAGNQFGGSANGVALPGALNAIAIGVNAGGRLIVGGANVSDRNVISGAFFDGINIQTTVQSSIDQCQIVNNLIGLAPNGINVVANNVGVNVGGSGCAIVRNRIVGNTGANIWLNGADSTGNVVQQNIIGVTVSDTGAPSFAASVGVLVTGNNNVIGAAGANSSASFGNTIRYMLGGGVVVKDTAAGNLIHANAIYDNGATGNGMDIDLLPTGGTAGNTPNDVGDADTGPNQLQNFPVPIGLAYTGSGSSNRPALFSGELDSKSGNYRIDAYFSSAVNAGGRGHAQVHLGRQTVTLLQGNATVSFTMAILVPDQLPNGVLSFTATDISGNTSELGTAISIVPPVQDAMFKDGFE